MQHSRQVTALVAILLVACGGDGPSGPGTGNPPVGSTGSFARLDSVAIPEAGTSPGGWLVNLREVRSTQAAIYVPLMRLANNNTEMDTKVLRRSSGVAVGSWQQSQLPSRSSATIHPVRQTETGNTFSVYWADIDHIGMQNMNTGTPSFTWTNDTSLVAIISDHSTFARSWGIDYGGAVWRESVVQGGGATHKRWELIGGGGGLSSMHVYGYGATDGTLYWGNGDRFQVVTPTGIRQTYDLAQFGATGLGVNRVLEAAGDIWVGYNDKVLRLGDDGRLTQFAAGAPTFGASSFCVLGGSVYLSDGTRMSVNGGPRQDFLMKPGSSGTQQQVMATAIARTLLQFNMHCNHGSLSNAIFVVGPTQLYQIDPIASY